MRSRGGLSYSGRLGPERGPTHCIGDCLAPLSSSPAPLVPLVLRTADCLLCAGRGRRSPGAARGFHGDDCFSGFSTGARSSRLLSFCPSLVRNSAARARNAFWSEFSAFFWSHGKPLYPASFIARPRHG